VIAMTTPNAEKILSGNFPVFFFRNKPGEIRIFKALDWPSSVSSWEVMAKN